MYETYLIRDYDGEKLGQCFHGQSYTAAKANFDEMTDAEFEYIRDMQDAPVWQQLDPSTATIHLDYDGANVLLLTIRS